MVDRLSGAIIAAGRGERLRAASGGLPKPLVELGGKILLIRQIEALMRLGANPIHVIVNSETAALLDRRRVLLPDAVQLIVADTPNSMESLLTLGEKIMPGQFILSTVDAIVPEGKLCRFETQARSAIASGSLDGALGVTRWSGEQRPLFVDVADDGTIKRFGDRAGTMITAGIYVFSTRIFAQASAARGLRLDALRRFLGLLTETGARFAAIEVTGTVDLDEPADLDRARAVVAQRGIGASG
jgi:choline kinase